MRSILQDLFERSRREFSTRGSAGLLGLLAALRAADLPRNGRYAETHIYTHAHTDLPRNGRYAETHIYTHTYGPALQKQRQASAAGVCRLPVRDICVCMYVCIYTHLYTYVDIDMYVQSAPRHTRTGGRQTSHIYMYANIIYLSVHSCM